MPSTRPLRSSSAALQVSGLGAPGVAGHVTPVEVALQARALAAEQAPTPTVHGPPTTKVSSTRPSQLLSTPSQRSAWPGKRRGSVSSQSPARAVKRSRSRSQS